MNISLENIFCRPVSHSYARYDPHGSIHIFTIVFLYFFSPLILHFCSINWSEARTCRIFSILLFCRFPRNLPSTGSSVITCESRGVPPAIFAGLASLFYLFNDRISEEHAFQILEPASFLPIPRTLFRKNAPCKRNAHEGSTSQPLVILSQPADSDAQTKRLKSTTITLAYRHSERYP